MMISKKYLRVLELKVLLDLVADQFNGLAGLAKILVNTAAATTLLTVAFVLGLVLLLHIVVFSLLVRHVDII
jgi:hypothetical protein